MDLILHNGAYANCTIDRKHELLLFGKDGNEGLVPVVTALGKQAPCKEDINFYWLLPPHRYNARKSGKPFSITVGASPATAAATAATKACRQALLTAKASKNAALIAAAQGHLKAAEDAEAQAVQADAGLLAQYQQRIKQFLVRVPFEFRHSGAPQH
jgi:hypothetical protein